MFIYGLRCVIIMLIQPILLLFYVALCLIKNIQGSIIFYKRASSVIFVCVSAILGFSVLTTGMCD